MLYKLNTYVYKNSVQFSVNSYDVCEMMNKNFELQLTLFKEASSL